MCLSIERASAKTIISFPNLLRVYLSKHCILEGGGRTLDHDSTTLPRLSSKNSAFKESPQNWSYVSLCPRGPKKKKKRVFGRLSLRFTSLCFNAEQPMSDRVLQVFSAVGSGYRVCVLSCCSCVVTIGLVTAAVISNGQTPVLIGAIVAFLPLIVCTIYFCSLEATLLHLKQHQQQSPTAFAV